MKTEYVSYKIVEETWSLLHAVIYSGDNPGAKEPVCFWFHGGGWIVGNEKEPESLPQLLELLINNGFKVISVEYRLCNKRNHYRELFGDCSDFLRYFSKKQKEFGIDINRCIFAGISAGGQIALEEALCGSRWGKDNGEVFPRPFAVLDFCGPTDFSEIKFVWKEDFSNSIFGALLGDEHMNDTELLNILSPLSVAKTMPVSELPPVIAVNGSLDDVVVPEQPQLLKDYYDSVGAECELIIMENAWHTLEDHYKDNPPAVPSRQEMCESVFRFVEDHLNL